MSAPEMGRPEGCAHLGDHLRRPASRGCASSDPVAQLAARRAARREPQVGGDGGGGVQAPNGDARPDGHASLPRLQLRTLPPALAQHGETRTQGVPFQLLIAQTFRCGNTSLSAYSF